MRVALVAAAVLAGAMQTLHAQNQPAIVLVELFTSEGCSSCPPADALLRKLSGTHTASGQWIVGISEHVTYWNHLGWSDPFSQETYTQRQNAYGERFHLESVYTPQMVVNGAKQVVGSDDGAVAKAISSSAASSVALHLEPVDRAASVKTITVTYSVIGAPSAGLDVYAVIVDDTAASSVLRGENSGRTLTHISVARSLTKLATVKDSTIATASLAVPERIKGQPETGRHLIVFVQERGLGKVLAVESRPL